MTTLRRASPLGLVGFALFIGLLWLYPLATLRLPDQHDIPTHLRWAEQFTAALKDGWLLPKWAYAANYGLGDPSFVYYQPLFYYISGMFALLGLRSEYALLLAIIVPYLILGVIVYRGFLGSYPTLYALAGTAFVVGGPFFYFLSTNLGAFPWTLGIPFCVLFAAESVRERPRTLIVAILLSLICLSHLLSGLMTLCATGLARLVLDFPSRRTIAGHINWGCGIVLGLALSAFFMYPAVTQIRLITPSGWGLGNTMWSTAFVFPLAHAGAGARWAAIQWPLGAVALATIALCFVSPKPTNAMQTRSRRLATVALASLALSTELAYPLFYFVPQMQMLQYPYRFLFLAAILGGIALAIQMSEGAWSRWGKGLRIATVLVLATQCALTAFLVLGMVRSGVRLPDRATFMSGRFGQPEYVPAVRGPHWKDYVDAGKLPGECSRLGIRCESIIQRTHDFSVGVDTANAVTLRLPVYAFPAWSVHVDGATQPLHADPDTGLIAVNLMPGRHTVDLAWSGLPADTTGKRISAVALLILLGGLALQAMRKVRAPVVHDPLLARASSDKDDTMPAL
jgi:hypothetical protein